MDDGSWGKIVYDLKPYQILDAGEYYSVWEDYKQIASFKSRDKAFGYIKFLVRYL